MGVVAAIAALTYLAFPVSMNASTAGFSFLLAVLLVATFGTLSEAVVASVVAAVCLNYFFLPPLFRFSIASPQDWTALVVFLATAGIVSKLSSTAKSQTEAAVSRGLEMERLYTLSRSVLLNTATGSTAREVTLQIARVFDFTSVSLLERSTEIVFRAGTVDLPEWDDRLRTAALNGTMFTDPATGTLATSVRLGADVIGSLVLRGPSLSDSALQSLVNLVAIALERSRMLETTSAAELIRKNEELKSTLLDAIAHEFKTPLTSIKAAASALRSGVADPKSRQDLIEAIDEESDRMGRLVTDAIQMARIEAGQLRLERQDTQVRQIVEGALAALSGLFDGRSVTLRIGEDLLAHADAEMVQLAVKQVLDNALKYSPTNSPILVEGGERDEEVYITVFNEGPGIPDSEQHRIFERYYRSPETREQVPGTGIGLAIAREIMTAHGGRIWAESNPGQGSRVSLVLPAKGRSA